uniref:GumC family protein n=1 Tax=Sphingorhabdus lacus TaxID=392610 RepID=UPI003593D748
MNPPTQATSIISSPSFEPIDGQAQIAPPIILQYWQVVLRWKWVIVGIISAALALGFVVTLLATPQYTATSRIEISRDQKKITNVEALESSEAGRDLEFYQTQYSLLQARSLAERVARSLRLATNDGFFEAHGVKTETNSLFTGKTSKVLTARDRQKREKLAVDILLDQASISPIRNSALIDISYTSARPELSAQIANAWTQQFITQSMDRRFASTADARKFLEGRLADLRARLETSERDLVNYASNRGIVALGKSKDLNGKTEVERTLLSSDLEALNLALIEATADRISAESRVKQGNAGANAAALGNVAIAQLRQRQAEVSADYAKLLVQFEPGYPAVRALAEQIKVLDASIAREEKRVVYSRTSEFREAVQRESDIREKVEALKSGMDQQQRDSIQYNIYQREADTNRELYDGLLQRYKEIGVAGVGANNIAIVDTATTPDKPSSPNLPLNLALSLLAGIGIAAVATFALNQIDEGLRDPGNVNRLLNLPLLGSVPDVEQADTLALLQDAKSILSEAYLSIRSNLAFSTDHGVPRALMVTSTRPAEGKSTTSMALATMLGRTGKNVLIIDADMRSPSIHTFTGHTNSMGLSNFLAGDNDWMHLIRETDIKGMSLLTAGPTPPSAAELLSSDRMLMLVKQLLEHYDHVVIDSPPILGLADAPLLSRAVEGCVFVAEAEGVAIRGIKASLGRLQAVHAHIFGVVLTKLRDRQAGYGYGYGYGYGAEKP